jgi:hypothetical protein
MKSPDSSPDPIAIGRESSETAHLVAEPSVPAGRLRRRRLLAGLPFVIGAALLGKRPELAYSGSDGDWTLSGNAPANATSFLRTRNARALTLKTNNRNRFGPNTARSGLAAKRSVHHEPPLWQYFPAPLSGG